MNLTPAQLARLELLRAHKASGDAAWKAHATFDRHGASSATQAQQALIIAATAGGEWTNRLRSDLEILEFILNEPSPVFCYPNTDCTHLTTFMGDVLAHIRSKGPLYRGGFQGNWRQTFRAQGINGRTYFGTIYGTYARMRTTTRA